MKKLVSTERLVLLVVGAALAAFLLIAELMPQGRPAAPRGLEPGKTIPVDITLVTADSTDLACSGSVESQGARCAFDADGQPHGADRLAGGMLAPYMTVGNVLYLIPDLWQEPAIAARLQEEPPAGVPRGQLRRFTASCQMTLEKKVRNFYVRWVPTAEWSHRPEAWVGRVSGCTIK